MDPFHRLRTAEAEVLPVAEYQEEFDEVFANARDTMWKLERAQEFYEPDVESWRAMMEGDWDRSLALMQERYAPLAEMYARSPEFRRLRIVETPVTPYLQWEMHFLALRLAAGERIRVLPAGAVHDLERRAPLPELVIFSRSLCYEVLYDGIGLHTGARRVTGPDVVGPCLDALMGLYDQAEHLADYHKREVVPLAPPLTEGGGIPHWFRRPH
ncbi:DUF6879 family protein [Sphaerisporangium perillae]|uniref:DUF6879 family protein n=1 Tax=Sphaerisporangium perillae TaxID=2935860 RepID=UPI00200BF934|nr:DUF6879 family protein [Sphaerisporangium perillae]